MLEIEIKSLLGEKDVCDKLKSNMEKKYSGMKMIGNNSQLNHYFIGGDIDKLFTKLSTYISKEDIHKFENIVKSGKNHSVRTRETNEKVLFVVKASIDDTTSSNGISRIEFESVIKDVTLDELDKMILETGFEYQAKWSRQREEYDLGDNIHVCIDKNAGYGYVAEFEKMIEDNEDVEVAKVELRGIMSELGAEELKQDRLERMFEYYNKNWQDYYGTDRVFNIE